MTGEIMMIEVCRYMGGWDWHTYMTQPEWFIKLIVQKMETESRVDQARQKAHEIASKKR